MVFVFSLLIVVLSTGFFKLLEDTELDFKHGFNYGDDGSFGVFDGSFNCVPLSVFFYGGCLSFTGGLIRLIGLTGSRDYAVLSFFAADLFYLFNFKYAFESSIRHSRSSSIARRLKESLSISLPFFSCCKSS